MKLLRHARSLRSARPERVSSLGGPLRSLAASLAIHLMLVFTLSTFEAVSGGSPGAQPSVARVAHASGVFRRQPVYSSHGREAYREVEDTFVQSDEFELTELTLGSEFEGFVFVDEVLSPAFETIDPFAKLPTSTRFVEPVALELEEFTDRVAALERPQPEPEPTPVEPEEAGATEDTASTASSEVSAEADKQRATVIVGLPPAYPKVALRMGWEGTVLCSIEVDAAGQVVSVVVAESSGYEALDQAATKAILKWKFAAGSSGGQAIRSTIEHKVHFELTN